MRLSTLLLLCSLPGCVWECAYCSLEVGYCCLLEQGEEERVVRSPLHIASLRVECI